MRLEHSLKLEQTQKLIMTQELRQAIQLLQYNSLELNEYIKEQIEENPMLEMESSNIEIENAKKEDKDEIDLKDLAERYDDISYKSEINRNKDEYNFESFITRKESLKDYLMNQLNLTIMDDNDYLIGKYIIENIDRNGYLIITLEEINTYFKIHMQKTEKILKVIQSFDPIGVGARDLKECLLIQLKSKKDVDPVVISIIEKYLDDLSCNKIMKISKELNVDPSKIQSACDYIKTLNPKPGSGFGDSLEDTKFILPDASIEIVEGEYVILINDITGPSLNISNYYLSLMKNNKEENTKEFLSERFSKAMWIIKSIQQRRQTIYNVIEAILKFQIGFFKEGEKALVPLTLKEVADYIEMHESTVSRATNGKYVQTPRGLYELKYFFTSGVKDQRGGVSSSTSIKATIKEIIDEENPKKPYSDQKIADILNKKGSNISRRTVAKYREELDIPNSSKRKRYN